MLVSLGRGFSIALAAAVVVAAAPAASAAPDPPASTISRYMETTSHAHLWDLGCRLGKHATQGDRPKDAFVILEYGRAIRLPSGEFGATAYDGPDASTSDVRRAAQQFGVGFYACTPPLWLEPFQVKIAITTTNYADGYGSAVTFDHGRAWATMVNNAQDWLIDNGYSGKVSIVGGNDMELGWDGPDHTRHWVNGYDSVNDWRLIDDGGAAGCPPVGTCGTSEFPNWTQDDVWYIAWGSGASNPFPEIYLNPTDDYPNGIQARQWRRLSQYGINNHPVLGRMNFRGALSQHQACVDFPGSCGPTEDNTAAQSWTYLWNELNCDGCATADGIRWSSTITRDTYQ